MNIPFVTMSVSASLAFILEWLALLLFFYAAQAKFKKDVLAYHYFILGMAMASYRLCMWGWHAIPSLGDWDRQPHRWVLIAMVIACTWLVVLSVIGIVRAWRTRRTRRQQQSVAAAAEK